MIVFFFPRTRLLPARGGRLPELSICRRPSGAVATAGPPVRRWPEEKRNDHQPPALPPAIAASKTPRLHHDRSDNGDGQTIVVGRIRQRNRQQARVMRHPLVERADPLCPLGIGIS
jgi:hypothetical protein